MWPEPAVYDYELVSRIGSRPVTALEIAEHLKIDPDLITGDFEDYINSLIDSAVLFGEKYTKRTFIDSNFKAYLDQFLSGVSYELRRAPLASITSIKYYKSNVLTTISDTTYFNTTSSTFGRVGLLPSYSWPIADDRMHSIEIEFVAGYTDLPEDLKLAIKMHVGAMYNNRGDCDPVQLVSKTAQLLPPGARSIYDQNRIIDIVIGI